MSTSDAVNGPQAYVFMPEQAAPPIPVAGTVNAACIYTNGTSVYLSVNGGAYTPIVTGSGATVTLDAAYTGGNQINLTQAKGAVILSSARTSGNILQITTTNAPATVTAQVTGISVDLSSLGTAATPSTFNLPAIVVTGAFSSVAKARGSALVQIAAAYRNASAVSIGVKNKQALSGSIVQVGWDSTNYEGAVASSVLTGQTHVVTIDGQTNVDAATNNVEFVGLRVLAPRSTNTGSHSISIESNATGGDGLRVAMTPAAASATVDGIHVTTSANAGASSTGIRNTWQSLAGCSGGISRITLSVNGSSTGATTMLALLSSTATFTNGAALYGINMDLVNNLTYGSQVYGIYQTIRGANATIGGIAYRLDMGGTDGFSFRGLDFENTVTYTASRSGTNSNGAAFIFLYNHPVMSGAGQTLTMNDRIITIDHGPSTAGGASLVDSTYIVDIAANPVAGTNNIRVFSVAMNANNAGANTRMFYGTSAQTQGVLFDLNATGTLGGSFTGYSLTASAATAGAQVVKGLYLALPASSSASSIGAHVTTAQKAGTGVQVAFSGSLSATVVGYGLDLYNLTHNNNNLIGIYITIGTTTAASAQTVGGIVIDDWSTKQYTLQMLVRKKQGSIVHAEYQTDTTLDASICGVYLDLTGHVTANTKEVVGFYVEIPSGAATTSRGLTIKQGTTTSHQMEFVSVTDGTYFHILGPALGQLRIGAGTPATAGAGREIALVASDAGSTSGSAGGSIYLQEGAGNGGGARGQIAIGQNANMRLGFFAGGPAKQQTPTGSRGGNAALASLLTALAAYGLIVDGTSA